MSWFASNYWPALKAVIAAAWPDVQPGRLRMDTSIERIDWAQRWNDGELAPPWVTVQIDFAPTTEWCCGIVYQVDVTIWYICKLASAPAGMTASSFIADKLFDLVGALLGAQTLGTVEDGIPIDISAENAINVSFLDAKLPLQAGNLRASCIVAIPLEG